MIRTKRIASGGWRTVESFRNARGTAFFKAPSGALIKIRYGWAGSGSIVRNKPWTVETSRNWKLGWQLWATPGCKCWFRKQLM